MNFQQEPSLTERNQQLQMELTAKLRALEVEAALERVRTVAMNMRQPDDLLRICEILYSELQQLGCNALRNTMINIHDDVKGSFLNYDFSGYAGKTITTIFYDSHPVVESHVRQIKRGDDAFAEMEVKGKELANWRKFRKENGEQDDPRLSAIKALYYYFYSVAKGDLGISNFEPLPEDQLAILKRFSNVFDLAYKRYTDITNAEAQAREAQVEAALERVRSRTMAMQKSEELKEVIQVVYDQFVHLNIHIEHTGFIIDYKQRNDMQIWLADQFASPVQISIPYFDTPHWNSFIEAKEKGADFFANILAFEEKNKFYQDLFKLIPAFPEGSKKAIFSKPGLAISTVLLENVGLYIENFSGIPYTAGENNTLMRFGKVFQQTYTRFMDLQRAEAQARESQIQLALERVRARTMAMQHSNELPDAALLLSNQVKELGVQLMGASFQFWDDDRKEITAWSGNNGIMMPGFKIPVTEDLWYKNILEAGKKGEALYVQELGGEALKTHNQYLGSITSFNKALSSVGLDHSPATSLFLHAAYFSNGFILIITLDPCPGSYEIFKRFAKVFEQTNTRFLDLQKAEAQVRESKIEAALEKIRSRSLAMHNSVEIKYVVSTLFEKLKELNLVFDGGAAIHLFSKGSKDAVIWVASPDLTEPSCIHLPYDEKAFEENPIILDVWHAKDSGADIYNKFYSFEEKNKYFNYVFKYNDLITIPESGRQAILQTDSYTASFIAEQNSLLGANSWTRQLFSQDDFDIMKRIARVFEQAYVRFLDLQKAEAQAREAKIEAALEKIRSRSLAMHRSGELKDVMSVMFQRLTELDVLLGTVAIQVFDPVTKDCTFWVGNDKQEAAMIKLPYDEKIISEDNYMSDYWKARNSGESFFNRLYSYEQKNQYFHYVFANNDEVTIPRHVREFIMNAPGHVNTLIIEKNSALFADNYENQLYTEDKIDVLKRTAKVFDQAYVRFLDLQKAETQAREALIEGALERTRTQSMIMKHSNELDDTLRVFHEQILLLRIQSAFSFLWLPDENNNRHIFWAAWAENHPSIFKSKAINYPLDRNEPATAQCLVDWKGTELVVSYHVPPSGVENYFDAWQELIDGVEQLKPEYFRSGLYYVEAFMKYGCFGVMVATDLREDEKKILGRFAVEFERTYTRFLDLQKAEAQAREAQIEAGLERVRSRSMAMHNTSELQEVIHTVHRELLNLKIAINGGSFIAINSDIETTLRCWGSGGTADTSEEVHLPLYEKPFCTNLINKIKNGPGFFTEEYTQEEKKDFFTFLLKHNPWSGLDAKQKKETLSNPGGYTRSCCVSKNTSIFIINHLGERFSADENDILQRFGKVFEQTYTRFLDLQKAEAQAKEARIEAALERVRSRSMAMHKSNELLEAAEILFVEMQKLGIESLTAGYVLIDEEGKNGLNYTPDPSTKKILPLPIIIPHNETIHLLQVVENWKKGNPFFIVEMDEDETIKHQTFIAERSTNFPLNPAQLIAISPAELFLHNFYFKEGYVLTVGGTKLSVEQTAIMLRFTKVFQQTYTRFLDLQKAEAQTRESQIELSLERVRAKTMAMHNSTDVGETAAVMVDELQKLGIETIRCGIGIMHEPGDMEVWTISTDESYKTTIIIGWLDMNMHPLLHGAFQSWRNKVESYSYELKEADLLNYYNAINNYPGYPIRYDTANLPKQIHHNEFHFTEGTLFAFSLQQLTETQRKIFKRFAGVFGQTYRRYLDLKKAEAQARQAKIEAAMEKVRARAMAMQKPDELVEVAELLRREMGLLGVEELETSSIYIHHEETGKTACWYAIKDVQHPEKELVSDHMTIELDKTCVGKQMLAFYLSGQQQVSIPMQGDIRKEWINYCAAHSAVLEGFYGDSIPDRTYHLYKFSNGYMGAASPGDISAESWDLLRRATLVFSLAYTRFNDLQQAEAQAREAKIETALERVRSRTLAMQKSDDLVETAAEVFRQLISLGIEPNRLYIGIVKEESGDMEMWATDEDGKHAGKKFMFNKNENVSVKKLFDGWKAKEKSVKVDMQGIELEDYFHYLNNVMHIPFKGGLTQKRRVQSVAYFSKGFIGMASPDGQGEETIQLLERFAAVFNLSFTRFNDLKIAEAHAQQAEQDLIAIKEAKQKAEEALTELQATQKQLIQSEKMASLGELTAGIAHEIQNPLNFVNNFSEVSNELMDEMNAEIEKGDMEEARAIANEIKQNLEKINHHGKRADAIVKGMLQHSRSSSASKEPTDINRLADEYLRLAYHGLRAKDKSFNATLKTDFDETAGNINIVPQDIGRVILNLITNAFFATNERRKLLAMGYEPLVAISTKKMGNKIEISVRDNGGGIPQNIVDKIFQPFFTTKPTGQGTGLGLSLAYDIVKAHGGEMKVETKEGEGSEFMMTIPAIKTD